MDRLGRLPIRAKLTLAYSAGIAVVLAAIGLFLFLDFKSGLDTSLNTAMRARAGDIAAALRQDGITGLARQRALLAGGDLEAQVLSPDGAVLFSTPGTPTSALVSPHDTREATKGNRFTDEQERRRFLTRRSPDDHTVIAVMASLRQRERALELMKGALLVGGALALLIVAFAGYALAGAVLRPMEAMRGAAEQISDVDPHARLPLPLAEDEVHRLGVTLNEMLRRLERSRDRERAFLSDASHELRTPLSILKTEVEVALRTDNPPETLRAALRVVGEESDRLAQLAEDLLLVARSDAGRMELDQRPVRARDLLEGTERRFRVRAREGERPLGVGETTDALVDVDVPRIEQALSNLVDNALRHGDGPVTLEAVARDGHVELHVVDEGPGLPDEFLPHAFERFSRAGAGRAGPGTGLGLAIVDLIATAHGGQAGIGNRIQGNGTDAWLRFPRA
jgi:two-component system, OmpR family, sensor kinase